MAEVRQTTVNPDIPDPKQFGTRNQKNLKASYGGSPILSGEYTDETLRSLYADSALDGTVLNGLGFNSFNRDFSDAPNMADVPTGGGGLPTTPHVPNVTSPGPGSVFASDQAPYTGELLDPGVEFGSGLGAMVSPDVTSEPISKIGSDGVLTVGSYIMGRSFKGSDGQS